MADSTIACGEELYLTNSTDTLTKLLGLKSTSLPNMSVSGVDVTGQDDNCVTVTRAGLLDPGTLEANIYHNPNSATDQLILEHFFSKETRPGKIVAKDAAGATVETSVMVFIESYNQGDSVEPGGERMSSLTLRLTALPTQSVA